MGWFTSRTDRKYRRATEQESAQLMAALADAKNMYQAWLDKDQTTFDQYGSNYDVGGTTLAEAYKLWMRRWQPVLGTDPNSDYGQAERLMNAVHDIFSTSGPTRVKRDEITPEMIEASRQQAERENRNYDVGGVTHTPFSLEGLQQHIDMLDEIYRAGGQSRWGDINKLTTRMKYEGGLDRTLAQAFTSATIAGMTGAVAGGLGYGPLSYLSGAEGAAAAGAGASGMAATDVSGFGGGFGLDVSMGELFSGKELAWLAETAGLATGAAEDIAAANLQEFYGLTEYMPDPTGVSVSPGSGASPAVDPLGSSGLGTPVDPSVYGPTMATPGPEFTEPGLLERLVEGVGLSEMTPFEIAQGIVGLATGVGSLISGLSGGGGGDYSYSEGAPTDFAPIEPPTIDIGTQYPEPGSLASMNQADRIDAVNKLQQSIEETSGQTMSAREASATDLLAERDIRSIANRTPYERLAGKEPTLGPYRRSLA